MNRWRHGRAAGIAALALAAVAGRADATWSIIIVDTRTREIAVGSATCLTGFDLQANTPVVIVGVGGATAQSAVDSDGVNRTIIRDGLLSGGSPESILAELALRDSSHQSRQYGMVDASGRALTFTGSQAGAWAGGRTGTVGDLVYAVQGNVLTGQPVVDAAVDAIENSPGDLAEKLMVAMEAARQMGGDGRCSCSANNADGCGSPPPAFSKSAHIAYMIVARLGDRDGSNANYRLLGASSPSVIADLTGDGMPDHIVAASSGIGVRPGIGIPGGLPALGPTVITPYVATLRGLVAADFNADDALDLASADLNNDRVLVFGGASGLGVMDPAPFPTGDNPTAIGVGDFNHDGAPDVATLNAAALTVSVLLNSGGALGPPSSVAVPAGTTILRVGDLENDGDADVVVASPTAKQIVVYRNNGTGALTADPPMVFTLQPVQMVLADVNGDQRLDIVHVMSSEKQVRILRQTPQGDFAALAFATPSVPTSVNVADVNADSLQDIVYLQTGASTTRLAVMMGRDDGGFDTAVTYPVGFTGSNLTVADVNVDGLPDAVMTHASGGVMTVMHNSAGTFNAISGLAGGDYYLDFNVANQNAAAMDPVFQLRERYTAWETAMIGVPDAVRTSITFDPAAPWANGHAVTAMTIAARDRDGHPVTLTADQVTVESLASTPLGTVGPAAEGPGGVVLVPITTATACATEAFRVTIRSGQRRIVVTPDASLTYISPADVDRNGFVNGDDFDLFMSGFDAGDQALDVNGDGFMNGDDFDYFTERFESGC